MSQLVNFRDLGGIQTTGGRKVIHKRLLRSAQPIGLTAEDVETLRQHNLKAIIDFRTVTETINYPIDKVDGVSYTHIDIIGKNTTQVADPMQWMKILDESISNVELWFANTYKEFVTSESSRKAYGDFLRTCAEHETGALLFHCAAGKDRTGFASALILRLLGVSDEDIYTDYLKTLEYRPQIEATQLPKARARGMTEKQLESMKVLMGVKKEYITTALTAAEESFGSFDNYLAEGLGITQDGIARICDLYLE